ncbi:MAG: transcription/translation regulatory transformer protein RfaH [Gammaproteobacteria bacterium]|nr:transcription/translation regulatory transformer protein RfaH [Gammaproteobacteria bacterium]
MKHWYLVYSKPRGEELARVNLERQGFETYLPLVRQVRRRLGRRRLQVEPLFPRYLFIRLDRVQDNWAPIRSTLGVSQLVRFGEEPAIVPGELVEMVRQRADDAGIQDLPEAEFRPGQKVRVADGPMAGYEGIFVARSGAERVLVLLDIVGRHVKLKLEASALERPF